MIRFLERDLRRDSDERARLRGGQAIDQHDATHHERTRTIAARDEPAVDEELVQPLLDDLRHYFVDPYGEIQLGPSDETDALTFGTSVAGPNTSRVVARVAV